MHHSLMPAPFTPNPRNGAMHLPQTRGGQPAVYVSQIALATSVCRTQQIRNGAGNKAAYEAGNRKKRAGNWSGSTG